MKKIVDIVIVWVTLIMCCLFFCGFWSNVIFSIMTGLMIYGSYLILSESDNAELTLKEYLGFNLLKKYTGFDISENE